VLFNQEELNRLIATQQTIPKWHIGLDYAAELFHYCFVQLLFRYGKIGVLLILSCLFALTTFMSNFFRYLAGITMAKVRINVVYNLRLALFRKMLQCPLGYFTDKKKGDLMARITTDVQEIEYAVSDTLRVFLKEPTQLFCYISVLFYMSFKLTLFAFVFLPIVGSVLSMIVKRLQKWADETQHSLGNLLNLMEEVLTGIRIIKLFGAQKYVIEKFQQESHTYARTNKAVAYKASMTAPVSESLSVVAVSIITAYGGSLVLLNHGMLPPSVFIVYVIICVQSLIPIKMISRSIGCIQRGIAAGKRIFDLLDDTSLDSRADGNVPIAALEHEIAFKQVSFAYQPSTTVLHDISFTIQKGETVAIVGASGSGKSTLLALLAGLYQPTSGTITLDGIPLPQLKQDDLHRIMGIVTQETCLFHDTVLHNITFNRTGFTLSDVIEAAQVAFAHEFILALPQGYDTIIGTHGDVLSGGQKQRICITRALLGNPSILLLDEATSALDAVSERNVHERLQSLVEQKTSVVVTHSLSNCVQADKIIVLEEGKLVAQGTHQELLHKGGTYQKLFLLQQGKTGGS
jgi:subfamily B ATP-binding cassette protein MsbA